MSGGIPHRMQLFYSFINSNTAGTAITWKLFGVADNSWIQMSIMMSLHSMYSWTWTLVLLGRHPWLSLQPQCTDSSELIFSLFTSRGLDELFCITRLYIDTANTLRSQQHWILVELLHTTWIQMRWYEQSTSRWFISLGFYNTDERTQQSSSSLFTLLGFTIQMKGYVQLTSRLSISLRY